MTGEAAALAADLRQLAPGAVWVPLDSGHLIPFQLRPELLAH